MPASKVPPAYTIKKTLRALDIMRNFAKRPATDLPEAVSRIAMLGMMAGSALEDIEAISGWTLEEAIADLG